MIILNVFIFSFDVACLKKEKKKKQEGRRESQKGREERRLGRKVTLHESGNHGEDYL